MDPINTPDKSWIRDLEHVFQYGHKVSPRGMKCFEVIGYQSTVPMSNPIIYNKKRKLGYKFMAAEAAWILSGRNDVASISKYSKDIAQFSDNGDTFFGAYGPRLNHQLAYVAATLTSDPSSRQAVATIWRENPGPSRDIPCTVSLQWLIRHDTLHCVATMRSSDLWLGHPYDIFNFSAASFLLMLQLNSRRNETGDLPLVLGNLFLTAGSKHIYEKNLEQVGEVLEEYNSGAVIRDWREPCFAADRYDDEHDFIAHLWEVAEGPIGVHALMRK